MARWKGHAGSVRLRFREDDTSPGAQ
jgi:hypothetical protein